MHCNKTMGNEEICRKHKITSSKITWTFSNDYTVKNVFDKYIQLYCIVCLLIALITYKVIHRIQKSLLVHRNLKQKHIVGYCTYIKRVYNI